MTPSTDSTNPNPQRLSFAEIAAAGVKDSIASHTQSNNHHAAPHPPTAQEISKPAAAQTLSDPLSTQEIAGQQTLRQPASRDTQRVEATARGLLSARPPTVARYSGEDGQSSAPSSTDHVRPSSLDGKSIASGTTFAMDEKESLRPDDSASVMAAAEEEDVDLPSNTNLSSSRPSSDEGMRAFRQQLHEISALGPQARGPAPPLLPSGSIPQTQGSLYVPPLGPGIGVIPGRPLDGQVGVFDIQPDPKLIEALESPRDRIWVLKLEQDIFDFVKDAKEASLNLPQCNAYHRMLAHKIADYYMLGHLVDDSASVRLYKTPNCRIPPPLTAITTPSTAASTPPPGPPQMKILRRRDNDTSAGSGSNGPSKTGSENEDSGNEDDRKKAPASREEREARYEAARLRIMGSAKPSDMVELIKEPDESRSSSVAGRKTRKKQRSDSEDGFEARSAYSAYYPTAYSSSSSFAPSPYGHTHYVEGNMSGQGGYAAQTGQTMSQHGPHMVGNGNWSQAAYTHGGEQQQYWNASSAQPYDLSTDFQRAMSLQGGSAMVDGRAYPGFNPGSSPPHHAPPPNAWPQQAPPTLQRGPPSSYNHGQQYQERPPMMSSQSFEQQPYQFGQLPSQTFPGRPPSKLEHPLPGSYKGKHFNPQSQTFVPTHASTSAFRPYTSQAAMTTTPPPPVSMNYSVQQSLQSPRQRPSPTHQHNTGFPPHQPPPMPSRGPSHGSQPMMHPLPQPVFPRQPSPHAVLPAKPSPISNRAIDTGQIPLSASGPTSTGHSSIAKWGAPASLPAKPPPSNFDNAQRPPVPIVGKLPEPLPVPVYPAVVNGSGTPGMNKR